MSCQKKDARKRLLKEKSVYDVHMIYLKPFFCVL